MKRLLLVTASLLIGFAICANAQLTPQEAVLGMERGVNIGNTMEPPQEGWWGNPPVQQRAFDDYKNAGFTAIRIPITWDAHTSNTPPYTIESTWMARVDTVVSWGLRRGLFIIIDAHHETWLKTALADSATKVAHADSCVARFDSIWSQIATHFKDKSDSLIFEMINEPYPMADSNVNKLNARALKIIRRTNPTRIVAFSGYMWSNSDELITAAIPDTSDKYLIGYYHSYDPWPFGLQGPGTYGSASDIAATKAKFDQVTAWSQKNNIPVILDEFGYMKNCAYNSRMCAYATVVDQALQHGVGAFAWDDGGDFPIYGRTTYGFNEIKDILIYTFPESPNGLKISQIALATVKVQWHNRNAENDSIEVQRRAGTGNFVDYAEVASTDSVFTDSFAVAGTSYYYRLKITLKDSVQMQSYPVMLNVSATAVNQAGEPLKFGLSDNYPNPFNPTTVINYNLSALSDVTLKIHDILGRELATLAIGRQNAGSYTVTFNARDLASGVYFYRLVAEGHVITKKMILLK